MADCTFGAMKAADRAVALDLSLGLTGVVLAAVAVWSVNVIGTAFAGPTWLKVVWPLLIGAPLALRRRAPLLGWAIIWAGVSLQALITGNSPEGLELIFVFGVGSYSVAAYSPLRRAVAGLAVAAAGATVYGLANRDTMSGNTGVCGPTLSSRPRSWRPGWPASSSGDGERQPRTQHAPRPPSARPSERWLMSVPGWRASCTTLSRTT